MLRSSFVLSLVCVLTWSAQAQSTEEGRPRLEISIQGTVMALGVTDSPSSYGGVRIGPAWNPLPNLGLKGDIGVYRPAGHNFFTLMAGPEYSSLERYRAGWFFHPLFGLAHGSLQNGPSTPSLSSMGTGFSTRTGFATALGGGMDVRLTEHFIFRPLELELMRIPHQLVLRVSSGLAYRFKE